MIPDFDITGNLPAGIYKATILEFEKRFSINLKRKQIMEGIKILIEDLKKIGCKKIFIDGSYVTSKGLPNDFDACWDTNGVNITNALAMFPELNPKNRIQQKIKYNADIFPSKMFETSSSIYFIDFFQIDKNTGSKKGIIEIEIL